MSELTPEVELLRAVIANTDTLSDVTEIVASRDFLNPAHQVIYETILEGWANNKPVDPVILASELERKGMLNLAGGMDKIMDLSLGSPSQAGYFAGRVRDRAELYRMKQIGTELSQRTGIDGADPDIIREWLDEATAGITREDTGEIVSLSDGADEVIEDYFNPEDSPRFSTGFKELDEKLRGGLAGGQMVIVAARPGVGKSTLAVDIMRDGCIRHGKNAVFFSLEMSRKELITRIMSAENSIRLDAFDKRRVPEDKMRQIQNSLNQVGGLYIDDSPNMTMVDIRAKARQLNKRHRLDLIVIDYLQLMSSGKKIESRQNEVSEFSRQIKLLAKELDVPIIAVCQLNRGVESRDNPIPKVSDLRESGSLEQDADIVCLINRPDSQDLDHERAGEADLIIAKHRGGPIGTVVVPHQLHYSRFADMPN